MNAAERVGAVLRCLLDAAGAGLDRMAEFIKARRRPLRRASLLVEAPPRGNLRVGAAA